MGNSQETMAKGPLSSYQKASLTEKIIQLIGFDPDQYYTCSGEPKYINLAYDCIRTPKSCYCIKCMVEIGGPFLLITANIEALLPKKSDCLFNKLRLVKTYLPNLIITVEKVRFSSTDFCINNPWYKTIQELNKLLDQNIQKINISIHSNLDYYLIKDLTNIVISYLY